MRNAQSFLQTPGAISMDALSGNGTLAERGGSWLFLRWLGDQKGESIYGRLVQTSRTGVANVEDKANETFASLFGDFATAVYTDSLPGVPRESVPLRLRLTSRNLRQIFKRFSDIDRTGQTPIFPFTPIGIVTGGTATGVVVPGSMTYYLLTTTPNDPAVGLRFGRAADLSPFATDDAMQIGIFRLP